MTQPSPPSTSSGHIFTVLRLPGPKPPPNSVTVFEQQLLDGVLVAIYRPTGRLNARLMRRTNGDESTVADITSCRIDNPAVRPSLVDVAWNSSGQIKVCINGEIIGSTMDGAEAIASYTIPLKPAQDVVCDDFSRDNELARSLRRDKMAGHQPRRNRVRMGADYLFNALNDEVLQMEDLLRHIDNGRTHHVAGLTARLRTVVAKEKPLPLLQLCAAKLNAPLIIYTGAQPRLLPPVTPYQSLRFGIAPEPTDLFENPVDLDVWLDLPAGQTRENLFTHRELILAIGNSVASHVSQDVDPLVPMLRDLRAQFFGEFDSDALAQFIRLLALAVLCLARSLIAQSHSS